MLDKVYGLRKSCTRDIVAIVSNNLLFTPLQISDEPEICGTSKEVTLTVTIMEIHQILKQLLTVFLLSVVVALIQRYDESLVRFIKEFY